jgi:hypothetical protein
LTTSVAICYRHFVTDVTTDTGWLVLTFRLPARPTAARMRVWRQLQRLGALPAKGGAYVLPHTPQTREDFEWLRTEITSQRGDATLFAGHPLGKRASESLVSEFRAARARDFAALHRDAEALNNRPRTPGDARRNRLVRQLAERLTHLESIDFFGADRRAEAAAAVQALQRRTSGGKMIAASTPPQLKAQAFSGRVWVTRPRPGVDRMSCAWLIRRFIDAKARFIFSPDADTAARDHPRAVPFDMYGVEFGHHGSDCTFETLMRRFGLRAPGLEPIARIVHTVDLKDDRFVVPEASAIHKIVEGLRARYQDDAVLLAHGIEVIEALYAGTPREARPRRRRRLR